MEQNYYYHYLTNIGELTIVCNNTFITAIKFGHPQISNAINKRTILTDKAFEEITEYLSCQRYTFDLPLQPIGTEFQLKVWEQLLLIPYGETRCYTDIANAIGNPNAIRAVGMANNRNPIVIMIPCHRVIGKSGKLVGYAGGLKIKEKLLNIECSPK